jgi:CBS domain-containing protein
VCSRQGLADAQRGFEYEAGDLFPVSALMAGRAVMSTYTANADTFCLLLPASEMQALARDSAPFADYLNRRVQQFLELSRKSLQVAYAAQTLSEQSLETPLGDLVRRAACTVSPDTSIEVALRVMHDKRIGSVLVVDEDNGQALGILTRHDILGRVTLPGVVLTTPISAVMSQPVVTVSLQQNAQDAALAMSRHGIRHVPVTDAGGRVVGILSERDLFALQRLSLSHVSGAIRRATDLPSLRAASTDIRRLAERLLGQGVAARQLTELISQLNDLITLQLVEIVAQSRALDLGAACWLAFGSEGRGEQTIATDQDNGLIFAADDADAARPAWLAFAREVNDGLDACGYPLCKGNVMAVNPECCLTPAEWAARFDDWMDRGTPQDLLNASIYFDLRAVAGRLELATPLREQVTARAADLPRFISQLAGNALQRRPPLNWRGAIDTHDVDGRACIDLKLQGTAIFVDAARIYALAHGIDATGTRQRLEAVARALRLEESEAGAWVTGFEFLQALRLEIQIGAAGAVAPDSPNLVDVDALNDIDRRMLREALRMARRLQQRLEMDYRR